MKKVVLVLLTLAMLLVLASCGSNKYEKYDALIECLEAEDYEGAYLELVNLAKENGAITESEEPETETVEINSENWQEYFEIRQSADVSKDAFGDVQNVYAGYRLCVKDSYLGKIVDVDLAIEYLKSGKIAAVMQYDIENDLLEVGVPFTDEELKEKGYYLDKEETENDTTTLSGSYDLERGYGIGSFQGGWQADSFTVENGIAKWDGAFYTQIELPRVEGTITLEK